MLMSFFYTQFYGILGIVFALACCPLVPVLLDLCGLYTHLHHLKVLCVILCSYTVISKFQVLGLPTEYFGLVQVHNQNYLIVC